MKIYAAYEAYFREKEKRASAFLRTVSGGLISLVFCVCCMFFFMAGVLAVNADAVGADTSLSTEKKRDRLVTEENVSEYGAWDEEEEYGPLTYEAVMNTEWIVDGKTGLCENAYIENSKENANSVILRVFVGDEEALVYESPVLKVGNTIKTLSLSKKLDAGTYPAVARYFLLSDIGKELGSVSVGINIVVGEG